MATVRPSVILRLVRHNRPDRRTSENGSVRCDTKGMSGSAGVSACRADSGIRPTNFPSRGVPWSPERQLVCHPEQPRGIYCPSIVAGHAGRIPPRGHPDPSLTLGMTSTCTGDILVATMSLTLMTRAWRTAAIAIGLTIAFPSRPFVDEIPTSVALFAFLKPEANRLRVLVRLPLESIRDVEFPQRGPGYLDLARTAPLLPDAAKLWVADYVEVYEGDRQLDRGSVVATRVSLPSDRAFASYVSALAQVTGPPLADSIAIPWQQAMLDVLLEYPITSPAAKFSIQPSLAHLGVRTTTVLRFLPPNGAERAF